MRLFYILLLSFNFYNVLGTILAPLTNDDRDYYNPGSCTENERVVSGECADCPQGLSNPFEFIADDTVFYAGKPCANTTDCEQKCMADKSCEGYSHHYGKYNNYLYKARMGWIDYNNLNINGVVDMVWNSNAYGNSHAFIVLVDDGSVKRVVVDGGSGPDVEITSGAKSIHSSEKAFAVLMNNGTIIAWGDANHGGNTTGVDLSSGFVSITSNYYGFAGLKSDGSAVAWGDSRYGGDATGVDISSGVLKIYSQKHAFAALKSDGSVQAWGDASYGGTDPGIGAGSGVVKIFPNKDDTSSWKASNERAFAALLSNRTVIAWGASGYGGNAPSGLTDVVNIYSTRYAFAALKTDGSVKAWGASGYGGTDPGLTGNVSTIFSNHFAFAALKSDGSVQVLGDSSYGGTDPGITSGVVTIFSTYSAFAALKTDGSVKVWGDSGYGGKDPGIGSGFSNIYATGGAFAGLKSDGSVVAWGSSGYGGSGTQNNVKHIDVGAGISHVFTSKDGFAFVSFQGLRYGSKSSGFGKSFKLKGDDPSALNSLGYRIDDSVKYGSTACDNSTDCGQKCSVDASCQGYTRSGGVLHTWGSFAHGGYGPLLSGVTKVYGGYNSRSFHAIMYDGNIKSWGDTIFGGGGTDPNARNVKDIVSTYYHVMALLEDGTTRSWGDHDTKDIDLLTGVTKIVASSGAFAALKSDGTVVTDGGIFSGGCNSGSGIHNSYSCKPDDLADVVDMFANQGSFAALRSNGSLVVWGDADQGGSATGVDLSSGVVEVVANDWAWAARKSDGTVVAWGYQTEGGNASGVNLTGVTNIYSTNYAFAALKSDGSVVAWGKPDDGGTAPSITSGVTKIYAAKYAFAALKSNGSIVSWGSYVRNSPTGDFTGVDIITNNGGFAALKSDGTVVTWGSAGSTAAPSGLSGVTKIVASQGAFAALKSDGSVVAWGSISSGGCDSGSGTTSFNCKPSDLTGVTDIYATKQAFAAITSIQSEYGPLVAGSGDSLVKNADTTCDTSSSSGCAQNERVVSNACAACPVGTTNAAGDDPTGSDTTCDPILCGANLRVVNKDCVSCPAGTTNAAGDDASGADTNCDPILCGADQYVSSHVCTPCLTGSTNAAGDDASGADTTCDEPVYQASTKVYGGNSCSVVNDCKTKCALDNTCDGFSTITTSSMGYRNTAWMSGAAACQAITGSLNGNGGFGNFPPGCSRPYGASTTPIYNTNSWPSCNNKCWGPITTTTYSYGTETAATGGNSQQLVSRSTTCGKNFHVSSNACTACPPGTENDAGDDFSGADTTCDPISCGANLRVVNNDCVSCPPGTSNDAGDDASGTDTNCDPILCGANEHVVSNVCTPCPDTSTKPAGDDASGADTVCACPANEFLNATSQCDTCATGTGGDGSACDKCAENYHVSSNQCVACPDGTRPAGDDSTGADTVCVCPADQIMNATNQCEACPTGRSGDGSVCDKCAENYRSGSAACVSCPTGTVNVAGDDANGNISYCDRVVPCGQNEFFNTNHQCEVCASGTYNDVGDTVVGSCDDTEKCLENAHVETTYNSDNTKMYGLTACSDTLDCQTKCTMDSACAGISEKVGKIAMGWYHTCALFTNSSVYCLGRNAEGQLGDGTVGSDVYTWVYTGINNAIDIACNGRTSAAVLADNTVRFWGQEQRHWGDGSITGSSTPVISRRTITDAVKISMGTTTTCILTTSNGLTCMGAYSGTGPNFQPTSIFSSGIIDFSFGNTHGCVVKEDNTARCWGDNPGRLGDGTTYSRTTPTLVSGGISFSRIYASVEHTCGIATNSKVYCWGLKSGYRVEPGVSDSTEQLTPLDLGLNAKDMALGNRLTCFIKLNDELHCWGVAENPFQTTPALITTSILQVAVSQFYYGSSMVAIGSNGNLYSLGYNPEGQLAIGANGPQQTVVETASDMMFVYKAYGPLVSGTATSFTKDKGCKLCPAGYINDAMDDPSGLDTPCDFIPCQINERITNGQCTPCTVGATRAAGDSDPLVDTYCTCGINQHVVSGVCTECPSGSTKAAGDDAAGADTVCLIAPCAKDYRVKDNVCVLCPTGMTNDAGDTNANGDTYCDSTFVCGEDQYVSNHQCVNCPTAKTTPYGSNPAGADTECNWIVCGRDEYSNGASCQSCATGSYNNPGDTLETVTTCNDAQICKENHQLSFKYTLQANYQISNGAGYLAENAITDFDYAKKLCDLDSSCNGLTKDSSNNYYLSDGTASSNSAYDAYNINRAAFDCLACRGSGTHAAGEDPNTATGITNCAYAGCPANYGSSGGSCVACTDGKVRNPPINPEQDHKCTIVPCAENERVEPYVDFETSTNFYGGNVCTSEADCEAKCSADASCEGYSILESAELLSNTQVSYTGTSCYGVNDCATKCGGDSNCQGFSRSVVTVLNYAGINDVPTDTTRDECQNVWFSKSFLGDISYGWAPKGCITVNANAGCNGKPEYRRWNTQGCTDCNERNHPSYGYCNGADAIK